MLVVNVVVIVVVNVVVGCCIVITFFGSIKLLSLVFARSSSLLLCHSFDLFLFPASIKSMRLATMPSRST